ncbi:hypothetical protein D3C76_416680 [compost metagenome]
MKPAFDLLQGFFRLRSIIAKDVADNLNVLIERSFPAVPFPPPPLRIVPGIHPNRGQFNVRLLIYMVKDKLDSSVHLNFAIAYKRLQSNKYF